MVLNSTSMIPSGIPVPPKLLFAPILTTRTTYLPHSLSPRPALQQVVQRCVAHSVSNVSFCRRLEMTSDTHDLQLGVPVIEKIKCRPRPPY